MNAEAAADSALSAGVRLIQYRNKKGTRREIYETSVRLAHAVHRAGGLIIVNDHADIAAALDADGLHLGQDDLPIEHARKIIGRKKLIGVSTHSVAEARAAEAAGADYIGFGPVFPTGTKEAGEAQGVGRLADVKRAVSIPVFAIGGINHLNVADVMRVGVDGAAVISAILSAGDIRAAASGMVKIIEGL